MLISQNTFYVCLHIKSAQNDANRLDLKCILPAINKNVFIITSIVGILTTMQVILNLV